MADVVGQDEAGGANDELQQGGGGNKNIDINSNNITSGENNDEHSKTNDINEARGAKITFPEEDGEIINDGGRKKDSRSEIRDLEKMVSHSLSKLMLATPKSLEKMIESISSSKQGSPRRAENANNANTDSNNRSGKNTTTNKRSYKNNGSNNDYEFDQSSPKMWSPPWSPARSNTNVNRDAFPQTSKRHELLKSKIKEMNSELNNSNTANNNDNVFANHYDSTGNLDNNSANSRAYRDAQHAVRDAQENRNASPLRQGLENAATTVNLNSYISPPSTRKQPNQTKLSSNSSKLAAGNFFGSSIIGSNNIPNSIGSRSSANYPKTAATSVSERVAQARKLDQQRLDSSTNRPNDSKHSLPTISNPDNSTKANGIANVIIGAANNIKDIGDKHRVADHSNGGGNNNIHSSNDNNNLVKYSTWRMDIENARNAIDIRQLRREIEGLKFGYQPHLAVVAAAEAVNENYTNKNHNSTNSMIKNHKSRRKNYPEEDNSLDRRIKDDPNDNISKDNSTIINGVSDSNMHNTTKEEDLNNATADQDGINHNDHNNKSNSASELDGEQPEGDRIDQNSENSILAKGLTKPCDLLEHNLQHHRIENRMLQKFGHLKDKIMSTMDKQGSYFFQNRVQFRQCEAEEALRRKREREAEEALLKLADSTTKQNLAESFELALAEILAFSSSKRQNEDEGEFIDPERIFLNVMAHPTGDTGNETANVAIIGTANEHSMDDLVSKNDNYRDSNADIVTDHDMSRKEDAAGGVDGSNNNNSTANDDRTNIVESKVINAATAKQITKLVDQEKTSISTSRRSSNANNNNNSNSNTTFMLRESPNFLAKQLGKLVEAAVTKEMDAGIDNYMKRNRPKTTEQGVNTDVAGMVVFEDVVAQEVNKRLKEMLLGESEVLDAIADKLLRKTSKKKNNADKQESSDDDVESSSASKSASKSSSAFSPGTQHDNASSSASPASSARKKPSSTQKKYLTEDEINVVVQRYVDEKVAAVMIEQKTPTTGTAASNFGALQQENRTNLDSDADNLGQILEKVDKKIDEKITSALAASSKSDKEDAGGPDAMDDSDARAMSRRLVQLDNLVHELTGQLKESSERLMQIQEAQQTTLEEFREKVVTTEVEVESCNRIVENLQAMLQTQNESILSQNESILSQKKLLTETINQKKLFSEFEDEIGERFAKDAEGIEVLREHLQKLEARQKTLDEKITEDTEGNLSILFNQQQNYEKRLDAIEDYFEQENINMQK